MNRPPILVTATYSGVLQMWNTTDTKWKTRRVEYPSADYLVNTLKVDSTRTRLAVGGTNMVKIYDIAQGEFNPTQFKMHNESNITDIGGFSFIFGESL